MSAEWIEDQDVVAVPINDEQGVASADYHREVRAQFTRPLPTPTNRLNRTARAVVTEECLTAHEPAGDEVPIGQPSNHACQIRGVVPERSRIGGMPRTATSSKAMVHPSHEGSSVMTSVSGSFGWGGSAQLAAMSATTAQENVQQENRGGLVKGETGVTFDDRSPPAVC